MVLLLIALALPALCRADGMVLWGGSGGSTWRYAAESEQQALLRLVDGREHLLLRVRVDDADEKGLLWIFPIPGDPAKVEIDVARKFEAVRGQSVEDALHNEVRRLGDSALMAHPGALTAEFWPLLIHPQYLLPMFGLGELASNMEGGSGTPSPPPVPDVTVHKHIEKRGLIVEVLSARTAAGLSRYLSSKGISPGPLAGSVLARYIGKEYCFVASWAGTGPANASELGLSVSFPATALYFPLAPSSVYGSRRLPITIQAEGLLTPRLTPPLEGLARVSHMREYGGSGRLFTVIRFHAPASALTEDLWIDPVAPPAAARQARLLSALEAGLNRVIIPLCLLITLAAVGWFLFPERRDRRGLLDLALLWLAGWLMPLLIGLTLLFLRTRAGTLPLTTTIKPQWLRTMDRRKLLFLPLWGALFVLLAQGLAALAGVEDGLRREPFLPMGLAQNAAVAVLLLWCQAAAFLAMHGARDGVVRLRRWQAAYWTTGAAAVLVVLGSRGAYQRGFELYGAELPWLTQLAFDSGRILLAIPVFIYGACLGLFLLLPAVTLSCLDVSERRKAAGLGALWGLFFAPWPYSMATLIAPALGGAFGWSLLCLRSAWDPRGGRSFLTGTYWRGTLDWFGALALAFLLFQHQRVPRSDWTPERLARVFADDDSLAATTAGMVIEEKLDASGRAAVLPRLLPLRETADHDLRERARRRLRSLARKDLRAARAFLDEAARPGDEQVRALNALSGWLDPSIVRVLIEQVRAGEPDARRAAARALLALGHEETARIYKAAGGDWELAKTARAAAQRRRWEELTRLGAAEALLEAASEPGADWTLSPAQLLGQSGEAPAAVAAVRKMLESRPRARWEAAQALGATRTRDMAPVLRKDLVSRDPLRRATALSVLDWLAGKDDAAIVPDALRLLGDPSPQVQETSAAILGRRQAAAGPALTRNLRAADPRARSGALRALRRIGVYDDAVLDGLGWILKNDHDAGNREYAARMLGLSKRPEAVAMLVDALNDRHSSVTDRAAEGLGHIGPAAASAVPALLRALEEKSRDKDIYADFLPYARAALFEIGTPDSKAAATRLMPGGDK